MNLSDFSKSASSFGSGGTRLLFQSVNSITNSLLLAQDLPPPTDIVKLFSLAYISLHSENVDVITLVKIKL
jgi:hypothetical protein